MPFNGYLAHTDGCRVTRNAVGTRAAANTARRRTLVVGGIGRGSADNMELEGNGASYSLDPVTYDEVLLATPLEQLADAWCTLRALSKRLRQGGILTVIAGRRGRLALHSADIDAVLRVAGFEPVHDERLSATYRVRARFTPLSVSDRTCSVIVPCRNEVDNIEPLVRRLPSIGTRTEILFVDGASTDGTPQRILEVARLHPDRDIRLLQQEALQGKAAAVFQGFDAANGEVLIILDADMTVAPEDLPRFYLAIVEGAAQLANGTRFAYPMQAGAMPASNRIGNRIFAAMMSRLLGHRVGDTLCGTKALSRTDWHRIAAVRQQFGGHDRWGDFDLLQGAALCGLLVTDVPVRYYARTAGESKMYPFQHGMQLVRSYLAALRALKAPDRRRA